MDGIRCGIYQCWCGVGHLWGGHHGAKEQALERLLTHQQERGH